MKHYFLLLVLCITIRCSDKFNNTNIVDKLEFYYVPWLLRREYSLTEEDLLNLNDPFISYYCTSDKSIAKEFYALYAKSNFQPTSMGYMEPFMIVNVQYKNGKLLRIAIDKSISLFQLENRIYVLNPALLHESERVKSWAE